MFLSKMHIMAGDWANEPIMRSGKSKFPLGQFESGDASPLWHCHEHLVKSFSASIIRTIDDSSHTCSVPPVNSTLTLPQRERAGQRVLCMVPWAESAEHVFTGATL